ncbi:MAG: hypothetical protein A2Z99_06800 [Treponema sp. GWB1_62_6]|nr:MAG: hypothetical protein A2Z99_06800 [Treponema sp. GWB1_62_6]OHE66902.1 MAG: hypothetical protein A2Y36_15635 [Treponema sp. GWA1_62_8]OHE68303.1 MAG: hypothetical protein A2413_09755 [Treponema sp. RIFOXYC1_FULL_61_9]OHE69351.1 MAG: hypothetical protein A2001_12795 [Treponema sp. GWC1_61_84]HCM26232.1 hypothetical protein [Treponema sp.]
MKIRNKLLLIPALGFLFLLILFGTVYRGLSEQSERLDDIYNKRFKTYSACADLGQGILGFHSDLYKGIAWVSAGYDPGQVASLQESGKAAIAGIVAEIRNTAESAELETDQRELYASASAELVEYIDWAGRVTDIVGSDMAIANMFMGTAEDKMTGLRKTIVSLQTIQKRSSDEAFIAATRGSVDTLRAIVVIFLLSVGSTLAVSLVLNRSIVRSINSLSFRAADISNGSGDLTQKIQIDSRDELGELGTHFNKFIEKMEGVIAHIKQESGKTMKIGSALSRIAVDTSADTAEISMTVNSSKDSILRLDREIQDSVGIINQIAQRIDSMAKSMESESAAVTESSASIEQIDASINTITRIVEKKQEQSDRLSRTAMDGLQKMEESAEAIAEISRSAGDMMEMVDVINRITTNLNLLGMNAAIEAAHAGSAGKGFAVVAGEVGKLAVETADNAVSISDTLQVTIDRMQAATALNDAAQTAFADLAGGIQEIAAAMEETRKGMKEISAGSGEIVKTIDSLLEETSKNRMLSADINENAASIGSRMTKVSELSSQVSASMGEITSAISHISDIMNKLSDAGRTNEESIMEIDHELSGFKVRKEAARSA